MGNEERDGRGAHMLVGKGTRVTPTLIIIIIIKLKTDNAENNTENNTLTIQKTIQTIVNNSKQYKQ